MPSTHVYKALAFVLLLANTAISLDGKEALTDGQPLDNEVQPTDEGSQATNLLKTHKSLENNAQLPNMKLIIEKLDRKKMSPEVYLKNLIKLHDTVREKKVNSGLNNGSKQETQQIDMYMRFLGQLIQNKTSELMKNSKTKQKAEEITDKSEIDGMDMFTKESETTEPNTMEMTENDGLADYKRDEHSNRMKARKPKSHLRHPKRNFDQHLAEKVLPDDETDETVETANKERFAKYRHGVQNFYEDKVYEDDVHMAEDNHDGRQVVGSNERPQGEDPHNYQHNEPRPLLDTLILIMLAILATQCCIMAFLLLLKDKLITNLTFKYGQIRM